MKKILFTLLGCMVLASCNNEVEQMVANFEEQHDVLSVNEEGNSNVTLTDIQAYMDKGSDIASRNGGDGEIEVITYQNDTVMYLLKYAEGWEMMPGDKRFPLRVAYNDEGTLDYANMHDAQRAWFESMAEDIHYMKNNEEYYENENSKLWNRLKERKTSLKSRTVIDGQDGWIYHNTRVVTSVKVQKDHILGTVWHKNTPYNQFTPFELSSNSIHCSAGSTAVAVGQTLNYLHTFIGTPTQTVMTEEYDAVNRKYVFSNWSTSPWRNIAQGSDVHIARLLGHIGTLCDMEYVSWNNSYCNFQTDLIKALNTYGITATLQYSWNTDLILDNLNRNLPLLAEIRSRVIVEDKECEEDDGSHTVTIDGYKIIDTQYTDVYIHVEDPKSYPGDIYDHDASGDPIPEEGPTRETSYTTTDVYVLFNWGYGNTDNTAYLSNSNIFYNGASYRFTDRMWYNLRKL